MPRLRLEPGELGAINISTRTKKNGNVVYVGLARARRLDGKEIRVSANGASPTAARREVKRRFEVKKHDTVAKQAQRNARAEDDSETLSSGSKFSFLCEEWIKDEKDAKRISPQTLQLYEGVLQNHIKPHIGELRVREINAQIITKFLRERARSATPSAADSAYKIIRGGWKFAQRSGITERDVLGGVVRPTRRDDNTVDTTSRIVTPEQAKFFLDLCRFHSAELSLVMRIAAETGARPGEILALHEGALHPGVDPFIDLHGTVVRGDGGAVRQPHGKTRSSMRSVSVSTEVMDDLLLAVTKTKEKWPEPPKEAIGLVPCFPNIRGGWRSVQTINSWRREALKDSGVEWVSARVLRRTLATFLAAGQGDQAAADQLGHARVSVTARHYIDTHGAVRQAGPSAFAAFLDSDKEE